jgi:penicillin-binding protein 1C
VLGAESAAEVLDILRRAPHPGGRMPASLARGAPDIAFKTGTSYGFRDAWAAGVTGRYTLVVWTGRADGAPREGITGREGALPLLFRLADGLERIEPGSVSRAEDRAPVPDVPGTMAQYRTDPAPHILFPPDGAEVWSEGEGRGFVLAAQARGALDWYADGEPVDRNALGEPVWVPPGPGFYAVTAVDESGRMAQSRVRIRTGG